MRMPYEGFPCGVTGVRRLRNEEPLHALTALVKKTLDVAHREGRTRSLQISMPKSIIKV